MKQRSRSVATPDVKGASPRSGGMLKGGTPKTGSGGRKRGDGGGGWFSGWGGGWVWYGVLVLLRGWGAVGPWGWWSGYVHPDEFFQSPEVAAGAVLGHTQLATPWEFHPSFACRSISLPLLVSGIPFAALEYLNRVVPPLVPEGTLLSGFALLVAPRFAVFLLSLIVDLSALKIARAWGLSASHTVSVLLTLASSWVMLLFHTRTFSNTIESIIFGFSAFIALRAMAPQQKGLGLLWDAVLGMTIAAGVFTRFTYLFFFMPVGLAYLLFHSRSGLWPTQPGHRFVGRAVAMFGRLCVMLAGFLALSFLLVVLDSLYFGTLTLSLHGSVVPWHGLMAVLSRPAEWAHVAFAGTLTLTPWNSLRYNMQVDNLKEHGIHPHYTHALVNFPLLYGPLALAACANGIRFVWSLLSGAQGQPNSATSSDSATITLRRRGRWVLALSIVSGLGILSLAPHQEPRFLVPLVLPLSILFPLFGGDEEQQKKKTQKQTQTTKRRSGSGGLTSVAKCLRPWTWVAFNVALLLFFGYLHQAGVVPSLLSLSSATPQADGQVTHVVYFSTYMPPRYLLANRTDLVIHDVGGDATKLAAVLDLLAQEPHVYAVVPASVNRARHLPHFTSQVQFWPSLSTEDLPRALAELALVLLRRG